MAGTDVAASDRVGGGPEGLPVDVVVVEPVVRSLAEAVALAIAEVLMHAASLAPTAVAEGGAEPVLPSRTASPASAAAISAASPGPSAGEGAVTSAASTHILAYFRPGVLHRKRGEGPVFDRREVVLLVALPLGRSLAGEGSARNLEIVVGKRLGHPSAVDAVLERVPPLKLAEFGRVGAVGRRVALLLTRLEKEICIY